MGAVVSISGSVRALVSQVVYCGSVAFTKPNLWVPMTEKVSESVVPKVASAFCRSLAWNA